MRIVQLPVVEKQSSQKQPAFSRQAAAPVADSFTRTAAQAPAPRFGWFWQSRDRQFYNAVGRGDVAAVQRLIAEGADVNAKNKDGQTPLMKAAAINHVELVTLLLNHKADRTLRDKEGSTALYYAVMDKPSGREPHKQAQLVKLLAEPSQVNLLNASERSPFFHTVKNGLDEAAQHLLSLGADVRAQDDNGMTTLMYAAWTGRPALAEAIIKAVPPEDRVDFVNATNKWGNTALTLLGDRKDRKEVRQVLFAYGARTE